MSLYLDTSVLLPCYLPEAFSRKAARRLAQEERLIVSYLTEVEFYSSLSKKLRMGEIAEQDAKLMANSFILHLEAGLYERAWITFDCFQSAKTLLQELEAPLRTLDALHLACCRLSNYRLLTADSTMAKGAQQLNIDCEYLPDSS